MQNVLQINTPRTIQRAKVNGIIIFNLQESQSDMTFTYYKHYLEMTILRVMAIRIWSSKLCLSSFLLSEIKLVPAELWQESAAR